jgi:hypothetical protein
MVTPDPSRRSGRLKSLARYKPGNNGCQTLRVWIRQRQYCPTLFLTQCSAHTRTLVAPLAETDVPVSQ